MPCTIADYSRGRGIILEEFVKDDIGALQYGVMAGFDPFERNGFRKAVVVDIFAVNCSIVGAADECCLTGDAIEKLERIGGTDSVHERSFARMVRVMW